MATRSREATQGDHASGPTADWKPQILLLIPKRDELNMAAAVFGFPDDEPTSLLNGRYEAWNLRLNNLTLAVVLVDSQDYGEVVVATRTALDEFDPAIALCVGTAAGRKDRTTYLDVVLATGVMVATQWRSENGKLLPQWDDIHNPTKDVLSDIDRFVKASSWREQGRSLFAAAVSASSESATAVPESWPTVHDGWVVTATVLMKDEVLLDQIWAWNARLRAFDMESAGFVTACNSVRARPWFVVRAVSDYGTQKSKRDDLRPAAGAAAATVARCLLESGLRRTHPLRVGPDEKNDSRLSKDNFFSRLSMKSFIADHLPERLGVTLDPKALTEDLTITDLAALCAQRRSVASVHPILDDMREEYFTLKYIDYDDVADVRGYIGPAWADDVLSAFSFVGIEPSLADILYVGVGTGRDLQLVCPVSKSLTGVDLSSAMLQRAKQVAPHMVSVRDCAETLQNVRDNSVDLYLSLRTYQSSLFDAPPALRQALRVLRGHGAFVVSIPGGFLDRTADGELKYVPGLLMPGSNVVDRSRPRKIADRLLSQLESLMFERIGFHQRETDLYIYARAPAAT